MHSATATSPAGKSVAATKVSTARIAHRDPLIVQWGLTLAAVATIGVLIVVPVVNVFYQAFANGLSTYWNNLWHDPDTLSAIGLTLLVAPIAVVANLIF